MKIFVFIIVSFFLFSGTTHAGGWGSQEVQGGLINRLITDHASLIIIGLILFFGLLQLFILLSVVRYLKYIKKTIKVLLAYPKPIKETLLKIELLLQWNYYVSNIRDINLRIEAYQTRMETYRDDQSKIGFIQIDIENLKGELQFQVDKERVLAKKLGIPSYSESDPLLADDMETRSSSTPPPNPNR